MSKNESNIVVYGRNGVQDVKKPSIILTNENKLVLANALKFDSLDSLEFSDKRKFDAPDTAIIRDQLTASIKATMAKWYADFTLRSVFKVRQAGGPGVQNLRYDEKDWTGKARIVGSTTNAPPKISSSVNPNYSPVFNLEIDAEFSIYQLEASRLGAEPLDGTIFDQTKYAHEWAFNDLGYGISDDPLAKNYPGLLNQLSKLITASDDADLANHNILASTGPVNRDFLLSIIDVPESFTNKKQATPTKLVMPIAQANKIMHQVIEDSNGETVGNYILKNTTIKEIIGVSEFKDVTGIAGVTNPLLVCNDDDMIGEVIETVPFMILPTQSHRTRFVTTTRSSSGGLFLYKKAWALVKNCGA